MILSRYGGTGENIVKIWGTVENVILSRCGGGGGAGENVILSRYGGQVGET